MSDIKDPPILIAPTAAVTATAPPVAPTSVTPVSTAAAAGTAGTVSAFPVSLQGQPSPEETSSSPPQIVLQAEPVDTLHVLESTELMGSIFLLKLKKFLEKNSDSTNDIHINKILGIVDTSDSGHTEAIIKRNILNHCQSQSPIVSALAVTRGGGKLKNKRYHRSLKTKGKRRNKKTKKRNKKTKKRNKKTKKRKK